MPLVDPNGPWWSQQCPARPYGLSHAHDSQCTDGHTSGQCCECGQMWRHYPPTAEFVAPPIDVAARLESLGLNPPREPEETEMEDIGAEPGPEHDDNTPVEPKMVSGTGPTGKPDGIGRGDLAPTTKRKLLARAGWQRWLDEREG